MNYYQAYKNFINGRSVNEGIRMTAGILMPAFIMSYFDMLAVGIIMSVGALCVSAADSPGPAQHRTTGMLICNGVIFLVAAIIGWAVYSPLVLGFILFLLCFIFSMIGVYGARASSIGIAALLVMVLNLQHPKQGWDIVINAACILAGGIWYMIFSLLLYKLRPYKLIQQILGDGIQSLSDYLRTRSKFYEKNINYDLVYQQLLQQQVDVQEKQNMVSEMLFKTRTIVKESTHKGRILVMIYLDVADLFERVMTSYQQYNTIHVFFDETEILGDMKQLLLLMADELYEIGVAVKSGIASPENPALSQHIKIVKEKYNDLRKNFMKADNLDGFIAMGRIMVNIQDVADRINVLHHYTTYDRKLKKRKSQQIDYAKFVDHNSIEPQIFFDNLNFNSNIFRHSLRMAITVLAGYLISLFFSIGHSYWILLTIIVIIKPAYSLTKKRNKDRLTGTLLGIGIGIIVLFFIKNSTALLIIMIFFMACTYIFLRTNYVISVLFMTPYLLLFFHLLYPSDFKTLLTDRIIDTIIGSAIAFVASIFLVPAWEHSTIKNYMVKMLNDNCNYYSFTAKAFMPGQFFSVDELKLLRKNALVTLANLSDAFTRMLSEPKRHQREVEEVHRFVVLNHTLTSHIATLSFYRQATDNIYQSNDFAEVIKDTTLFFNNSTAILQQQQITEEPSADKISLRTLNEKGNQLLQKRRQEIQQGLLETDTKRLLIQTKSVTDQFSYIYSIAADIHKISKAIELD